METEKIGIVMLVFFGWVSFVIALFVITYFLDKKYYLGFWYFTTFSLIFGFVTVFFMTL